MRHRSLVLFLLTCVTATALAQAPAGQTPVNLDRVGPAVGTAAPAFSLPDARGVTRSLQSLLGPKGALIVFNRSADW